ncbi:MAG: sigma-70 family RNA polymerase sigma factor [Alphaproteobacteria bacterium]|nr:sigma-70 family RNA polymerase sigma factor [Alphaproteobacteria bacterium]
MRIASMTLHRSGQLSDSVQDEALIRAAAAGSQDAWRRLVDRHLPAVTGYAWSMLGNRADAEDVAQDTFLRFFRKIATWQAGPPSVRAWLHRVATNLSIDRHRTGRLQAAVSSDADPADESADADMDDRLDRQAQLRRALAALTDRQRAAVVLVHYHGFTQQEVASMLDTSVEAVESLLARGRRVLRDRLAPILEHPEGEE